MLNQTLILLLIVTTLTACADRSETPKASSSPVYQAGSLQYPEQHPQLKLLTLSPVRQAQIEKIELPARLVWNEERTQRVYSAFSGRVATISADLGQHVAAGQVLAKYLRRILALRSQKHNARRPNLILQNRPSSDSKNFLNSV